MSTRAIWIDRSYKTELSKRAGTHGQATVNTKIPQELRNICVKSCNSNFFVNMFALVLFVVVIETGIFTSCIEILRLPVEIKLRGRPIDQATNGERRNFKPKPASLTQIR